MTVRSAFPAAALFAAVVVLSAPPTPVAAGGPLQLAQVAPAEFAAGEVRRIDREGRRVTLRHGEIPNLQMPPMTMVFQVDDAAALQALQIGDKVRFKAVERGGNYVVTEIEPAR